MSDGMDQLVRALASNRTEETRGERWLRRVGTAGRAMATAIFLVFLAIAAYLLWWAWHSGSWDEFYGQMVAVTVGVLSIWRVSASWPNARRNAALRLGAQALRELAARGDDQDAPLAEPQPAPLEGVELAASAMQIELRESYPTLMGIVWVLMWLIGVMGIGTIVLGVWLASQFANLPNRQSLAGWEIAILISVVGLCVAMGVVAVALPIWYTRRSIRQRGQGRYVADAWGLRRGEGRGQESVAWHEVRSFFRVNDISEPLTHPKADERMRQLAEHSDERVRHFADEMVAHLNQALSTRVSYVLDAGGKVWTWTVTPREQSRQATDYDYLWRTMVTHTHQPLRDLTLPAGRIVRAASAGQPVAGALTGPSATDSVVAAAATAPQHARSRDRASKRWGRIVTVAPIIAVLVFCGGGWSLQQYQRALYGGLPARIHAETPLFTDALAADDGLWPVHGVTADDAAYAYVNGVYQISGNGGEATLERRYGDAAVEVTVQQRPSNVNVKMGNLGQIGLTLRASDNPSGLVTFTIGPLGAWALMRYREWGPDAGQWQVLAGGEHNAAIHWGFGRNRLLVLMRGAEYVCFVNDQLIAVAHDDALTAGQVGLWLDDNTTIGRYANFAVYPAV